MRTLHMTTAAVLSGFSASAQAAVVELTCGDSSETPSFIRSYVLNEETGKGTVTIPTASYPNMPATFSPDEVRVVVSQDDLETMEYVVDRTTLKDKLVVSHSFDHDPSIMHQGQCKIAQHAKRKF